METAAGPIDASLLAAERLLAESTAFQRRGGWANAAEARQQGIYLFETFEENPAQLHRRRPFAAIWHADASDLEQYAGGQRNFLEPSGELVLMLTDRDRYPANRRQSGLDFCGWLSQVLCRDMAGHSAVSDRLPITAMRWLVRPTHSPALDEPSAGAYWHCGVLLTWKG